MQTHRVSPLPPSSPDNARTGTRAPITLRCEVRQGTRPWQAVVLEDLSETGFRIVGLAHADPAKAVSIRIPNLQLLTAQIRWVSGATVGCAFAAPLHVAVFEHLVRTIRGY